MEGEYTTPLPKNLRQKASVVQVIPLPPLPSNSELLSDQLVSCCSARSQNAAKMKDAQEDLLAPEENSIDRHKVESTQFESPLNETYSQPLALSSNVPSDDELYSQIQLEEQLYSRIPDIILGGNHYSTVAGSNSKDADAETVNDSDKKTMTDERPDNHYEKLQERTIMASPRSKSPRPPVSAKKDEKEESFWEKIGTLGRKKRIKEVQEVQEEGKYAIDSPGYAANPDMPPEEYALDENEERSMIEPRSLEDSKLQELIFVLIEWINDELADHRIIVKDIVEDLYDGQVLQKLLEKLTGEKLDVPEVTQSEEGQKQKLGVVLSAANRVLGRYPPYKWSVESVHSKNIVSILHLLVGLARQFRAPVRLPERVAVQLVVVRKKDSQLIHRTVREEITSTYDDLGMRCERDAFDALFDDVPEKLAVVRKSLVTFVNKHLNKVHLEVTDLDNQFHDGVFLTLLLGLLEGFFVPLGSFHLTPKTHDQKVHNVSFAFDLMQEVGLPKPKARPEDIVNLDLKSTLRVLYNLFTKYKAMS